jgi:glycyl-tRNA synthetase beta chain
MKKESTHTFLLEIGTEELPSDAMRVLRHELKGRIDHWLSEKNLFPEEELRNLLEAEDSLQDIRIEVTPRRIVIYMEGLPLWQPDRSEEIVGPSTRVALDENTQPTKVLLGFLKSKGATLDDIFKKTTEKGEYVAINLLRKGVKTEKLLKDFVSEIFDRFPFPKTMRWTSELQFPRPVRWILALWGKEVLKFKYAGLESGRLTFGHRFLANKPASISSADFDQLEKKLAALHVTLSFEERAEKIRQYLFKTNPHDKIDEELIKMSASLTEEPTFITGNFDKRYLKLPVEILATSMRKHQKIFVIYDNKGNVLPKFLAVVNGKKSKPRLIQKNYEHVLDAKLKDAEFFLKEDGKTKLEEKVERLKKVTFLGKLGTLFDKTERLVKLAETMSQELGLDKEALDNLKHAAWLSKADLETQMIYEFPELQGYAGSEYAKAEGVNKAVSLALKDYYLPTSATGDDPLELENVSQKKAPVRLTGALLGILDKLDTLVGALGLGLQVKGSEDPYALRRAANGIVLTVFELRRRNLASLSFSLETLISEDVNLYGDRLKLEKSEVVSRLRKLLEERVLWVLSGDRARDKEFLLAIFKASSDNLINVQERFAFLQEFEKTDPIALYQTYKILERTGNILKGAKGMDLSGSVDTSLFQEEAEKTLYEALQDAEGLVGDALKKGNYAEVTKLYAEKLYDRISVFFDQVLVNDENEQVRLNRLTLMRRINKLYAHSIAELSHLTQMEPQKENL